MISSTWAIPSICIDSEELKEVEITQEFPSRSSWRATSYLNGKWTQEKAGEIYN
jgi:hypothetical protein